MLISAGGSGGHLFPAQALAEQLKQDDCEVFFIGNGLSRSPYFDPRQYPFQEVASATISGRNPWHILKGIGMILGGMVRSYRIIRRFKPDIVVGFGSYQSVPAILSAKILSKPILLHEANAIPGRVNRILSPYVAQTAVHFSHTRQHLKGSSTVASMPMKKRSGITREEALAYYQLEKNRLTLLIFGGSQGAKKLNKLALEALINDVIPRVPHLQVLHFVGKGKGGKDFALAYEGAGIPSVVKPFEEHMEYAWALADVSLTRSGAGSLAEQEMFAVPGILVPFPYATENHQVFNARAFIENTEGAEYFVEKQLTSESLGAALIELLLNEEKRRRMREGILRHRDAREGETLHALVKKLMTS